MTSKRNKKTASKASPLLPSCIVMVVDRPGFAPYIDVKYFNGRKAVGPGELVVVKGDYQRGVIVLGENEYFEGGPRPIVKMDAELVVKQLKDMPAEPEDGKPIKCHIYRPRTSEEKTVAKSGVEITTIEDIDIDGGGGGIE